MGVGVASTGGDDCDDYFLIKNSTAVDATVTVNGSWLNIATDIDFYICDGTALSNPPPNNLPLCGGWTSKGYNDVIQTGGGFDGASNGSGTPETTTFTLPAGKTYLIWANTFDAHGVPATVYQLQVSGLP